jgi:hypothetical protein
MPRNRNLRRYEGTNLIFFLGFLLALGFFVTYIFHFYGTTDRAAGEPKIDTGIVQEVVSSATESCLFYLGEKVSEGSHRYRQPDVPADDDGLLRDLFAISGVNEIVVDQKLIVVHKAPSAHWEIIQPSAREVIAEYIMNLRARSAPGK